MTRFYQVAATVMTKRKDASGVEWCRVHQVPTFLLDANIQGIRDAAQAERIARDILGHGEDGTTVYALAVPADLECAL